MKAVIAAVLATLAISQAALAADDRPALIATRDAAITYKALGSGPAMEIRMVWLAAAKKMRMDMPGVGWAVADHAAGSGFIVMEEAKRIMDMPVNVRRNQLGPSTDAKFKREGADKVAGYDCTIWSYVEDKSSGRICLTEDGVMLRSHGTLSGVTGGMEAVEVSYTAQSTALFEPPAGYQRAQPRSQRSR